MRSMDRPGTSGRSSSRYTFGGEIDELGIVDLGVINLGCLLHLSSCINLVSRHTEEQEKNTLTNVSIPGSLAIHHDGKHHCQIPTPTIYTPISCILTHPVFKGPMVLAPLSEIPPIGRNPVYLSTLALFVLFQIPTALATNLAMLLVFRFVTGSGLRSPLPLVRIISSPVWGDLWFRRRSTRSCLPWHLRGSSSGDSAFSLVHSGHTREAVQRARSDQARK